VKERASLYFSEEEVVDEELGDADEVLDVVLAGAGVEPPAGAGTAGLAGGLVVSFFSPLVEAGFSPSVGGFILSE
jgi:hypothetical protein